MTKRILFIFLAVSLVSFTAYSNPAWAKGKQAKEEVQPIPLDGTEWKITLTPESGKGSAIQDTLIFTDKKVSSTSFQKKEYNPTNYTLSVKDDGSTVFETMQTKGENTVFWQGSTVDGKAIRGIVSVHEGKGAAEDYSLSGTMTGTVQPTEAPAAAPAPEVKKEKPVTPAAETKEKKRSKKESKEKPAVEVKAAAPTAPAVEVKVEAPVAAVPAVEVKTEAPAVQQ